MRGVHGYIKINDEGKVIESQNVENPEQWAEIITYNVKKGNEEARELGFGRMNGFAMIGKEYSLTFMKGGAYIVKTNEVNWQELFIKYTYSMTTLIAGIVLTALAILFFIIDLTPLVNSIPYVNSLAPEPRFYIPSILIIIGVILLATSKSKFNYRLS
jgi:hypothetical protein